jgi:hypothetical protein
MSRAAKPLLILSLSASLWLSACESLPVDDDVDPALSSPAAGETVGAEIAVEDALDDSPHPPEVAILAPPIDDDPEQLMGLGREDLGALLGKPSLVRREIPAEIWQYESKDCIFDVFLYDEAGRYQVSYLEARDDQARKTEARPCLNQLLRAQSSAPTS